MGSAKEMEDHLLSKQWEKVPGGWVHPNDKEFGKGIYSLQHAYRLQRGIEQLGG